LLTILGDHGHADLPKTARTLLSTPGTFATKRLAGMEYIFLGVTEKLLAIVKAFNIEYRWAANI
jgi:hypothetical protein